MNLVFIRRAMKKGIEWRCITSVPFLASPSLKGQARARRLKDDEVMLLLSSTDEYLQHVIIVLIETAMRRGELAAITLRDTKNGDDRVIPVSSKALTSIHYLIKHAKNFKPA